MSGHGCFSWKNGNRYAGEYSESKRSGSGVQHWSNGNRFEGEWVRDKRHGVGRMVFASEILGSNSADAGLWRNDAFVTAEETAAAVERARRAAMDARNRALEAQKVRDALIVLAPAVLEKRDGLSAARDELDSGAKVTHAAVRDEMAGRNA
eukprot:TRINITY_DN752_c0_g1_i4.p3 TRINITY_DN752_c0_g1~~TRINITY_DN752_c0_g1_i4.p3  ORF type:complete len:151 (+),score=27.42 TRINITY_DN752_c0_g1_i4:330-782(+)